MARSSRQILLASQRTHLKPCRPYSPPSRSLPQLATPSSPVSLSIRAAIPLSATTKNSSLTTSVRLQSITHQPNAGRGHPIHGWTLSRLIANITNDSAYPRYSLIPSRPYERHRVVSACLRWAIVSSSFLPSRKSHGCNRTRSRTSFRVSEPSNWSLHPACTCRVFRIGPSQVLNRYSLLLLMTQTSGDSPSVQVCRRAAKSIDPTARAWTGNPLS